MSEKTKLNKKMDGTYMLYSYFTRVLLTNDLNVIGGCFPEDFIVVFRWGSLFEMLHKGSEPRFVILYTRRF